MSSITAQVYYENRYLPGYSMHPSGLMGDSRLGDRPQNVTFVPEKCTGNLYFFNMHIDTELPSGMIYTRAR
jgi:hypothetical protein